MRRLSMEKTMQHLNDLYTEKRGLDLEWEQEHLKEGRYTLNMVKIDRKVREVLTDIRAAEAEKAHMENKIEDYLPTLLQTFRDVYKRRYLLGIFSLSHQVIF